MEQDILMQNCLKKRKTQDLSNDNKKNLSFFDKSLLVKKRRSDVVITIKFPNEIIVEILSFFTRIYLETIMKLVNKKFCKIVNSMKYPLHILHAIYIMVLNLNRSTYDNRNCLTIKGKKFGITNEYSFEEITSLKVPKFLRARNFFLEYFNCFCQRFSIYDNEKQKCFYKYHVKFLKMFNRLKTIFDNLEYTWLELTIQHNLVLDYILKNLTNTHFVTIFCCCCCSLERKTFFEFPCIKNCSNLYLEIDDKRIILTNEFMREIIKWIELDSLSKRHIDIFMFSFFQEVKILVQMLIKKFQNATKPKPYKIFIEAPNVEEMILAQTLQNKITNEELIIKVNGSEGMCCCCINRCLSK